MPAVLFNGYIVSFNLHTLLSSITEMRPEEAAQPEKNYTGQFSESKVPALIHVKLISGISMISQMNGF